MTVKSQELEAQLSADAAGLPEVSPENTMAPAIAIGGLLSVKKLAPFYAPLLAGKTTSSLSAKDRFLAIPDGGLGTFDEMFGEIEEGFLEAHERLEEPAVVIAHSLGGLFAVQLGLKHPDKIHAVIPLAGVEAGLDGETAAAWALRHGLGNPATAENLQADSDFMKAHREDVATGWSPDTSLHEIFPTVDVLVPKQQGLSLELPDGQKAEKRVVVPRGAPDFIARKLFGVPDNAEPLRNTLGAVGHVGIAWAPAVIQHARAIRRQAAGNAASTVIPFPAAGPKFATAA